VGDIGLAPAGGTAPRAFYGKRRTGCTLYKGMLYGNIMGWNMVAERLGMHGAAHSGRRHHCGAAPRLGC